MDTNKMREEFEVAFSDLLVSNGWSAGAVVACLERGPTGHYRSVKADASWWGWQASRSAVVVYLPEAESDMIDQVGGEQEVRYYPQRALIAAIEAQGLKVKP